MNNEGKSERRNMEESVDGQSNGKLPPRASSNDSGMQEMIWSDNPEKSYFKQMMEDEQMGRVFDGRSMDDSVLGNSTVASLMRDRKASTTIPDGGEDTGIASIVNSPPRTNAPFASAELLAIVGMEDDLSTIANDSILYPSNKKEQSNPRTRDFEEYKPSQNSKESKRQNLTIEIGDDEVVCGDKEELGDSFFSTKTPPDLIRVPWQLGKKSHKTGTPTTSESSPPRRGTNGDENGKLDDGTESTQDYFDEEEDAADALKRKRMYLMAASLAFILLVAIVALSMSLSRMRQQEDLQSTSSALGQDYGNTNLVSSSFDDDMLPFTPELNSNITDHAPLPPKPEKPTGAPTASPTVTQPTFSPTSAPTVSSIMNEIDTGLVSKEFFEAAIEDVIERISQASPKSLDQVLDVSSVQFRAAQWLASDPYYFAYGKRYGSWRIVQRWVLAVFYLSFEKTAPLLQTTDTVDTDTSSALLGSNWLSYDIGECDWFSSRPSDTCTTDGYFKRLDIRYGNLTGTVPAELSLLSNSLEFLVLPNNNIFGTIPTEFGLLTGLKRLQLTSNSLEGSIPSEFGNMASLGFIGLGRNDIGGTLPTEIGSIESLGTIGIEGNNIWGTIPTELGDLSALEYMSIESNQMYGTIPSEIGNLSMLQTFKSQLNYVSGTMPTEICNLDYAGTLQVMEANCNLNCNCCTECFGSYDQPRSINGDNCRNVIQPTTPGKQCYLQDESIFLTYINCQPMEEDWIGLYDASADPDDLGVSHLWAWTCGSQSCEDDALTITGSVEFSEKDVTGTSQVLRSDLAWPLPNGEYKAVLIRRNPGGPYVSYASSDTIYIKDAC